MLLLKRRINMEIVRIILLTLLIVCAISVSFTKNLLTSVIIFMSYSLVMSILWALLMAPDLAITEAAVGAGVTSVLFFITLRKIHLIKGEEGQNDESDTKHTTQLDREV